MWRQRGDSGGGARADAVYAPVAVGAVPLDAVGWSPGRFAGKKLYNRRRVWGVQPVTRSNLKVLAAASSPATLCVLPFVPSSSAAQATATQPSFKLTVEE